MNYIDMHCDTLGIAFAHDYITVDTMKEAMVDIDKLVKGGAAAQFFAVFMIDPGKNPEFAAWLGKDQLPPPEQYFEALRGIFDRTMIECSDRIAPAYSYSDYLRNRKAGKISAFLSVEDGFAIHEDLSVLDDYYDKGVRMLSPTWNHANSLGWPSSTDPEMMKKGLTDFGKEVIVRMNELGMIIDVSHLSDGGFYDIAEISRKPFVASHSNCRALASSPRNLTDEMIRIIAERGGVIGLNFYPPFLSDEAPEHLDQADALCRHITHMLNCGGEDCIALGSDFDGVTGTLEIADSSEMPRLFELLRQRGFRMSVIEKFARTNVERVLRETLM